MIWFQLILAVQFMSLLPSTIQAGRHRSAKGKEPVNDILPGAVLVKHYTGSDTVPICSGIHLKPWIVLTTAECVQGKEVDTLAVSVWYNPEVPPPSSTDPTDVSVSKVYIDPTYDTVRENNFAILIIYAQINWTVGEYTIVPHEVTPDSLQNKELFIYKWQTQDDLSYDTVLLLSEVGDTTACGELFDFNSRYCVVTKNSTAYSYNQVDVGTPLFYFKGNKKMIFAIFTTFDPDSATQGYAYRGLWPRYYWIEEIRNEHPVPPL